MLNIVSVFSNAESVSVADTRKGGATSIYTLCNLETCCRLGRTNPLLLGERDEGPELWESPGEVGQEGSFAFICTAVLCASASDFSAVDVLSVRSATRCWDDLKELSGRTERCQ